MSFITIPRGIEDPYYRYKMTIPTVRYAKSKTLITNIQTIAKELARPPELLLKCLSLHLHTGCSIKEFSLGGKVSVEEILTGIDFFIKVFVLCEECGNPETILNKTFKVCKSCGEKTKHTHIPEKLEKICIGTKQKKPRITKTSGECPLVDEWSSDEWSVPTDEVSVLQRLLDTTL